MLHVRLGFLLVVKRWVHGGQRVILSEMSTSDARLAYATTGVFLRKKKDFERRISEILRRRWLHFFLLVINSRQR